MSLTLYLLLFSCVAIYLYVWFRGKKCQKLFPEPPGMFFVGHLLDLKSPTAVFEVFSNYFRDYGKTVTLRTGIVTAVLTTDCKLIEYVLRGNKILNKSILYHFFTSWLGKNGLLYSEESMWKQDRKILNSGFNLETLKKCITTFESMGNSLIEKLNGIENKSNIDLHPFFSLCSLDIVVETIMGTKSNVQKGENYKFVTSINELCRIAVDRMMSPLKFINFTYMFTKDYFIEQKAIKHLQTFSDALINNKKQERTIKPFLKSKIDTSVLGLLIKMSCERQSFTNDEIRNHVHTFILGGYHTTAAALSFTLFCLADYQEVQDKVLDEQKNMFGEEKDPLITYQNLQDMKYLDKVIKESLRLYPPLPLIGRLTTEETRFDDYIIPANTNILMYIYGVHRNPEYFPNPDKFEPDRFDNAHKWKACTYIPFSVGIRNCIGMKYAMLEMKCIISKIIRHFEIKPATPKHILQLSGEAVLKSVNGVKVGLKKRM